MSQQPLLNDDFTGNTDLENSESYKYEAQYKKIEEEFKEIFEFVERVKKEGEHLRTMARKGKTVTEMPAKAGQ